MKCLSVETIPSVFGVIEKKTDNTKTVIFSSGVWGFSA
jgi:hypothetical protein